MTAHRTTLLGLGVAAVGALLLAALVLGGGNAGPARAEPTVGVLRATAGVAAGTPAESLAGSVERVDMPAGLAPADHLGDLSEVAGREVLRGIGQGEVLVAQQFAAPGPLQGGLVVPAGYEAVSVEADAAPGVEGYVTPGSRVNVYLTVTKAPDDAGSTVREEQHTQLVLAHVDVLAVTRGDLTGQARPPDERATEARIVLLLQLRPADAPVLIDAEQRGRLWFSLVNPDDPAPQAARVGASSYLLP